MNSRNQINLRFKTQKKALALARAFMELGAKDSNLYRLIQSQLSCHWTSPHRFCRRTNQAVFPAGGFYHAGRDIRLGFSLHILFDEQAFLQ